MKVGYATHGKLNQAKSNAILVTHAASGVRTSNAALIGPGKAYDTDKYFVVTVDAIGGGNSSQPKDGLGPKFPKYTIRDMVRAQHDLLTNGLGLAHVVAIGGPSMGAQQALEWGIHYPDFTDGLLLIVPASRSDRHVRALLPARLPGCEGAARASRPSRSTAIGHCALLPAGRCLNFEQKAACCWAGQPCPCRQVDLPARNRHAYGTGVAAALWVQNGPGRLQHVRSGVLGPPVSRQ
jgi:pimeloyl-ACP methyl ester carboxylesterase